MSEALIVFARYPRLGRVKTRLEPFLGRGACLRLHSAFLEDTVRRTAALAEHRFLYLADCTVSEARQLGSSRGWGNLQIRVQTGKGMGQRMSRAFQEVRRLHSRILIIGTDSPTLPLPTIPRAFQKLRECKVVIGPSEDGGYYLLGLAEARPALFEEIEWGSSSVLSQTLAKLGSSKYALLPAWYDVDRPRDLERLGDDLKRPFDGFPRKTKQVMDSLTWEKTSRQ